MKNTWLFAIFFLAIGMFVVSTPAQKKPVRPSSPKVVVTNASLPADVKKAKEKVEIQIENMNRFSEVLEPIAANIEKFENDLRTKKFSQSQLAKHEMNKKNVIQAIRNLKVGLTALEAEFRTKAALKKYYTRIRGISLLCGQAEQMAVGDNFVQSREPLAAIIDKLEATSLAIN